MFQSFTTQPDHLMSSVPWRFQISQTLQRIYTRSVPTFALRGSIIHCGKTRRYASSMSDQNGHASKAESSASHNKDLDANQGGDATKKTYHKQATGLAWETVQAHSAEKDLKLYGSCFCPFVHRVWISLEHKKLDYQYVEVRYATTTAVERRINTLTC
jgi:hypothetical protein